MRHLPAPEHTAFKVGAGSADACILTNSSEAGIFGQFI